jgi:sigma-B regulation protein RsbU (phosphoserine phosphatase)
VEGARLRQEDIKRQRLEEELSLGRQIQLSMLPKTVPDIRGWDMAAVYEPARVVGGDFYDYFELPGGPERLGMVIADVADKGVPAALFMALSRTIIRTVAFSGRGPAAALTRANQLILNDSQSDLFLSACYAILEVDTGRILLANAGHNRPLWYHASSNSVQEVKSRGIILGCFAPIQIDERRVTLAPGDAMLFYTDGVTEAMSPNQTMFSTQRLVEVFRSHAAEPAQAIANAIVKAYTDFAGGTEQSDDVTFFVVKRVVG